MINNQSILITGGTGTFGKAFTKHLLKNYSPKKIVIFSRDELKQSDMEKELKNDKLRFSLGDIKNYERCLIAFQNIDIIIHAAALKQIDRIEYNPWEAIETNINGSMNVIKAAIKNNVKKVVALNTDKSCLPITFYGGTKFLMERLFQSSHVYSQNYAIKLSIVRYGNIIGSRGSVLPYFLNLIKQSSNILPLTDKAMTRFWTSLNDAFKLVIDAIENGVGGDIYIPKCKSFKIVDLIKALNCNYEIVGMRGYEKIHETLISEFEKYYDYGKFYKIYSKLNYYNLEEKLKEYENNLKINGKLIKNRTYDSGNNKPYLSKNEIKDLINENLFN
jgi:FlaA1/EpsC-like NDP-sugar epimerase